MGTTNGLQVGDTGMASIGALAFGPDDVLFAADSRRAQVVAIDVADPSATAATGPFDLTDLDGALAAYLGCGVDDLSLRDLAVHPRTGNVYLSVMRGGASGQPVLVRVDRADGSLSDVPLDAVPHAVADLADAPAEDDERKDTWLGEGEGHEYNGRVIRVTRVPARLSAVTDLAYVDGTVLVAGMSDEEFASTLRRIPFPFDGRQATSALEIFHVSHGAWETAAPIRTFVPTADGIIASYTCTPLVHFPMSDLTDGARATGRTVAELGWGNQPLSMVPFRQDGEEHLLVSHTAYPPMKIARADIDRQEPLTEPKEPVGVPRTLEDLSGVTLMAPLDDAHVLVVQADDTGTRSLRSLKTASL